MPSRFGFSTKSESRPRRDAVLQAGQDAARRIDPIVRAVLEDLRSALDQIGTISVDGVRQPEVREGPEATSFVFGHWKLTAGAPGQPTPAGYEARVWLGGTASDAHSFLMMRVMTTHLSEAASEQLRQVICRETGLSEGITRLNAA